MGRDFIVRLASFVAWSRAFVVADAFRSNGDLADDMIMPMCRVIAQEWRVHFEIVNVSKPGLLATAAFPRSPFLTDVDDVANGS